MWAMRSARYIVILCLSIGLFAFTPSPVLGEVATDDEIQDVQDEDHHEEEPQDEANDEENTDEEEDEQSSSLRISQVQTYGYSENGETHGQDEFIALYNNSPEAIEITGWQVDFLTQNHDGSDSPSRSFVEFDDELEVGGFTYIMISFEEYIEGADFYYQYGWSYGGLPRSGGTVRIVDAEGEVVDLLGYGGAQNYWGEVAPAPDPGYSLQRCFSDENEYLRDTENNREDFLTEQTAFGVNLECPPEEEPITSNCEGVILSEIFNNPEGPSAGKQFVELHNPTDEYIPLENCGLQQGDSEPMYWFDEYELSPAEYYAVYDEQTEVRLPIAPGGTVYLLDHEENELDWVEYPQSLAEDQSWSLIDDEWVKTYAPTPHEINVAQELRPCPEGQERNAETNRCRLIVDEENGTDLAPCGEGRERNPETNRCRLIEPAERELVPCGDNQERNPETNRCRLIDSGERDLVPCAPNQERNPETNRCRLIDRGDHELAPCGEGRERNPETNRCRQVQTASAELTPCGEGRERNPETNRCRTVAQENEGSIASVQDVRTQESPPPTNWWLIAGLFGVGLLYAGWEWRFDIRNWLRGIKARQ